jgi:hypothetical protein
MAKIIHISTIKELAEAITRHNFTRAQIDTILSKFKQKPIILDDTMTPEDIADFLHEWSSYTNEKPIFLGLNIKIK